MKTTSSKNPLPISSTEYRNQLLNFIEYEKHVERKSNRETLTSHDPQTLQRIDIGYIPYAQPLGFRKVQLRVQPAVEDPSKIDLRDEYELFENSEVLVQCCQYKEDGQDDKYELIKTLSGKISRIDDRSVFIAFPDLGVSQERIDDAHDAMSDADFVHIGELLNPTVFDRERDAVSGLAEETLAYFTGKRDVDYTSNSRAIRESEQKDEELYENQKQAKAIDQALTADDLACIQGPPGTGKTRVIVELVRRFVEANLTVLVTAESHQAVGNILVGDSTDDNIDEHSLHYHKRINGFPLIRVNPKHKKMTPFERKHYSLEQGTSPIHDSGSESGIVYVSTNNSSARLGDTGSNPFDVAIIDEATQSRQSSTCIPVSRAEKTILVGDHKQLGPERPFTPDNAESPPDLDIDAEKSLFTHLYGDEGGVYGNGIGTMFNQQYRMHSDIAGFPSNEFYGGELTTAGESSLLNNLQPILAHHIENRESTNTERNHSEAEAVSDYISKLINIKDLSPDKIGVATAYRDQVPVLETAIQQRGINNKSILVQTFDAFQGSERQVMLLSFVRSNPNGNIGFLSGETGERRLNVAMTRAKHHCVLFGDWETLSQGSALYARLREYIKKTGGLVK